MRAAMATTTLPRSVPAAAAAASALAARLTASLTALDADLVAASEGELRQIGLVDGDRPVLGVMDQPFTREEPWGERLFHVTDPNGEEINEIGVTLKVKRV